MVSRVSLRPSSRERLAVVVWLCLMLMAVATMAGCGTQRTIHGVEYDLDWYRAAYAVGQTADLVTTAVAVNKGSEETNPLISWAGSAWWAPALVLKAIPVVCAEMAAAGGWPTGAKALYVLGGAVGLTAAVLNYQTIRDIDNTKPAVLTRVPVPQVTVGFGF